MNIYTIINRPNYVREVFSAILIYIFFLLQSISKQVDC